MRAEFPKRKAWLVEIEDSFCQTQECWFVTEDDANQAATWLRETTSYTIHDPFLSDLPTPRTFATFLREHNRRK